MVFWDANIVPYCRPPRQWLGAISQAGVVRLSVLTAVRNRPQRYVSTWQIAIINKKQGNCRYQTPLPVSWCPGKSAWVDAPRCQIRAATCWVSLSIRLFRVAYSWPLCANMRPFINPEVHKVSQSRQRYHAQNWWEWTCNSVDMLANRQTNKQTRRHTDTQTDTLIAIFCSLTGEIIKLDILSRAYIEKTTGLRWISFRCSKLVAQLINQ